MNLEINDRIAKVLKADFKKFWNIVERVEGEKGYHGVIIEMHKLTENECKILEEVLRTCKLHGAAVLAADVRKFLKAAEVGINNVTARTVRQAAWMLEKYITDLKTHLVFSKDKFAGGSHVAYFVNDVKYVPENVRERVREHVEVELVHIENDQRHSHDLDLFEEDVINKGPETMLRDRDYFSETPHLIERLRAETELYYATREMVGKKFTARGIGAADLDDATETSRSWGDKRLRMDSFGETPVVVDVLLEKDVDNSSRRSVHVNLYRWHAWNMRFFTPSEDELVRHTEGNAKTDFAPEIQVPVHPLVPCFDFRRHKRLRVHVNNLTAYKYRREVADGLILPERDKRLINMLVDQSSNQFQDVVEGKGASMNVLLGGSPGTGKTLSAEVFAEFKERPLYSVQCSQLGLEPAEIETNLAIILRRANRWNAVLLLDEADVYIRARGQDLVHNAIVGVFLRMLEYAQCILFMTTNLPESVDDAIASRCIVAIRYEVPGIAAQRQIWRTLADLNKLTISDETIAMFTSAHPHISGRDVKNLLKLASFQSKTLDLAALEFALEYKPTADAARG